MLMLDNVEIINYLFYNSIIFYDTFTN